MSTRTAALGYERNALLKTWLVVMAVVIAATIVISISMTRGGGSTTAPAKTANGPSRVVDYGPPSTTHRPIVVNGVVCGQCR